MVFYTATVTFFLSIPFALCGWLCPSPRDICLSAALGVGANLLLYCLLKAFERVNVSATAPFRYVEFALTVLAGFLFFGEIPEKSTVIGSLVIITTSAYVVLSQGNK
jgi:drug/metabolite transporter (DMT)-like permease